MTCFARTISGLAFYNPNDANIIITAIPGFYGRWVLWVHQHRSVVCMIKTHRQILSFLAYCVYPCFSGASQKNTKAFTGFALQRLHHLVFLGVFPPTAFASIIISYFARNIHKRNETSQNIHLHFAFHQAGIFSSGCSIS